MTDRKSEKRANGLDEIQAGLGTLMNALGNAISDVSQKLEEGQSGEVRRSFDITTGKGPLRAEAGVRIRMGGMPQAAEQKAATARDPAEPRKPSSHADPVQPKAPARPPEPEPRPVNYEILEDSRGWRLIADLPGISREDLILAEDKHILTIETQGRRHYRADVPWPAERAVADLDIRLHNGILELFLAEPGGGH